MIYVCGPPCSETPRDSSDDESRNFGKFIDRNKELRLAFLKLLLPACGTLAGFGGGISSPAPQLMAATLRFSRRIVSLSLDRSSIKISLQNETKFKFNACRSRGHRERERERNLLESLLDILEVRPLVRFVRPAL